MRRPLRSLAGALILLASVGIQAPATSNAVKVQAGGPVADSRGNVYCTFNFVFTDGSRHYIGTADHCADETLYPGAESLRIGDRVRTGNVDAVAGRLGTAHEIGTVVVSDGGIDFALIKIDAGVNVVAEVRGWRGPTGVAAPSETKTGDIVLATGYGLGFGDLSYTRSRRGLLTGHDDQWQWANVATLIGDSGGPVMTANGKALGTINKLGANSASLERGPTVANILRRMSTAGYTLSLVHGRSVSSSL